MMRVSTAIPLGYEVGTGELISIPLHHMAISGLTQRSGKTTAAQTIMAGLPPGYRALAFRTKRGELDFSDAHPAQPYFEAHTDWEYVESLLEAEMREKLRMERSFIIRACKGTTTLQEVYANICRLHDEARRGFDEGVWTNLQAYFEKILPQLERFPFASSLDLREGSNVMDLGKFSEEVQSLVIASCLEEIHHRYRNTLVVVPEAWKFAPQQRGNPVKWAAQHVIREGAVLGIYLLLDSQDVTGIDKALLKSCDVWLLGRQREKNEVERVLAQLPLPRGQRPRPDDVMQLKVGHFYVAADTWCRLVYVRPVWMEEEPAQAVAMGREVLTHNGLAEVIEEELGKENAPLPLTSGKLKVQVKIPEPFPPEEAHLSVEEAPWRDSSVPEDGDTLQSDEEDDPMLREEVEGLRKRIEALENGRPMVVRMVGVPALHKAIRNRMQIAAQELLDQVRTTDLSERQRQMLAVLVSDGGPLTITAVAAKLGVRLAGGGTHTSWSQDMSALDRFRWVYKDKSNRGFRPRIGLRVGEYLEPWSPTDQEIEAVVSNILAALAPSVGVEVAS